MKGGEMRYVQVAIPWTPHPTPRMPRRWPAELAQSLGLGEKAGCGSPRWPWKLMAPNPEVHGN